MKDWKMIERLARDLETTRQFMERLDQQLTEVLDLDHTTLEECRELTDIVGLSTTLSRIEDRLEELRYAEQDGL